MKWEEGLMMALALLAAPLILLLVVVTQQFTGTPVDPCTGRFKVGARIWYHGDAQGIVLQRNCKELTYTVFLAGGETFHDVGEEDIFPTPQISTDDS